MAFALVPIDRLVRVAGPEIKCPCGLIEGGAAAGIDPPFADEAGEVSGIPEEGGIRLPKVWQRGLKVVHAMTPRVLTGECAGAADRTNRCGDEGIVENHSPFR